MSAEACEVQVWIDQSFKKAVLLKKLEVTGSVPLSCDAVTIGAGRVKLFESVVGTFLKSWKL